MASELAFAECKDVVPSAPASTKELLAEFNKFDLDGDALLTPGRMRSFRAGFGACVFAFVCR